MDAHIENAKVLEQELDWFKQELEQRLKHYFNDSFPQEMTISPPQYNPEHMPYAQFIGHHNFSPHERIVLMLALAPEIRPHVLDIFFTKNEITERTFTEFGGILGHRHGGFLPTIETALFILAGNQLAHRLAYRYLFEHNHKFQKLNILELEEDDKREPFASMPLRLSQHTLDYLIHGQASEPRFGSNFPAKKLHTLMEWEDLILSPYTWEQLKELQVWLEHGDELLREWQLEKHIKPGYRCLFYGPPGTGKTLTATLLGKRSRRSVYRIDLSQVISKYIGETEKNLEKVFQQAEQRDWILFFDEADSLFGKRTSVSDAHDRYANQGTSYLLQRTEDCPNVVILASNLKGNIDEAFSRRFQSHIYFPMPQKTERYELWQKGFSPISTLDKDVDLDEVSEKYELSGGSIINVIRYCSLMALKKGTTEISAYDLRIGLQREYSKEGKTILENT